MATDTQVSGQEASSATTLVSDLYSTIAKFRGNPYKFLLATLKNPDDSHADVAKSVGVTPESAYNWRYALPGFAAALQAVQEHRQDLRSEYARLAFLEAAPKLADAMIARGFGTGRDAQRAGERILETVGVLPKGGAEPSQTPVQVVTHTYVLVQRDAVPQGMVVEGQARELPPRGKEDA